MCFLKKTVFIQKRNPYHKKKDIRYGNFYYISGKIFHFTVLLLLQKSGLL